MEKLNAALPTLTDDDIKKIFEVNDPTEFAKLKNSGRPFKSKEEFVNLVGKSDRRRAIQLWENLRNNQGKIPNAIS